MSDPRIAKLAAVLVRYSVDVQPGEVVSIGGDAAAAPLLREVYREVLQRGAHPLLLPSLGFEDVLYTHASDDQLGWVSPIENLLAKQIDASIRVRAAQNTRQLSQVDPKRQRLYRAARTELFNTFAQRAARGELKWTLTLFPTHAYAQEADMSLTEFQDFVYRATYADQDDPVARWRAVQARQQSLVDWLTGKKEVNLKGPYIDLSLSIDGRRFINCAGDKNMPDGEVFTGPVEESVNGWVEYTYPAILQGREVEGIRLVFEEGRVVEASAKKNEDFLLTTIDTDPGARYVGEFAVGTNDNIQHFTKNILFDEKIGGTIHMALGRGYPETGSQNTSAIHWDMICDMSAGEIHVDGELFYQNGQFAIESD